MEVVVRWFFLHFRIWEVPNSTSGGRTDTMTLLLNSLLTVSRKCSVQ